MAQYFAFAGKNARDVDTVVRELRTTADERVRENEKRGRRN